MSEGSRNAEGGDTCANSGEGRKTILGCFKEYSGAFQGEEWANSEDLLRRELNHTVLRATGRVSCWC